MERNNNMKKLFKKTGSILFCFLPLLLAVILQFSISIPAVMIKSFSLLADNPELLSNPVAYEAILKKSVSGSFSVGISIIYAILAALIMGFWYWKKFAPKKGTRRNIPQLINLKMFAGLLILMTGLQHLSTYIVSLTSLINADWYHSYEALMEDFGFSDVSWILILYTIFIAPVSEELIFRGVTMHYAQKAMPFWIANIFQALLFGIFHGNVVQGTYAFVVGLFFGYVCYRGGSIYLSILFHLLFNLWGVLGLGSFLYYGSSGILTSLSFLLTVAITAFGFYLYRNGSINRKTVMSAAQASDTL